MNSRFLTPAIGCALLCFRPVAVAADAPPPPAAAEKAQPKSSSDALRRELEAMLETDQAQRQQMTKVGNEHGQNSPEMTALWEKQKESDLHNIKRLEEIIAEVGWPKRSVFGNQASQAAFLILQHSDLSYQKKYLPLAREAVAANEMRGSSLALLEDRILLREGKKQIYGSQVRRNDAGQWEADALEDPAHVDERRAAVGLQPLAEYLAGFAQRDGGAVNDGKGNQPAPTAPPLTQKLFDAADDAQTAYAKLKEIKPQGGDAGVQFQFACRDFCARFPDSALYVAVRVMAARAWSWLRDPDRAQLKDWDPTEAEHDAKLGPEQQATVAMSVAQARASRQNTPGSAPWSERAFDAVAAAARNHRATKAARDALIPAALNVAPEKALPVLRELYPDDSAVAACIKVIEAVGQPCDFQLKTLDGRSLAARDFSGKVVMLVFSSGATGAVAAFVPPLKQIAADNEARGLIVAWVSMDATRAAAEEFLKTNALTWPTQCDGLAWRTPLASRFLIRVTPCYLLIDRRGILRYRGMANPSPETVKHVEALLAESPPPANP